MRGSGWHRNSRRIQTATAALREGWQTTYGVADPLTTLAERDSPTHTLRVSVTDVTSGAGASKAGDP